MSKLQTQNLVQIYTNLTTALLLSNAGYCLVLTASTIEHSDVGLHVNYTTTQGGVVLCRNEVPPGVPTNYNPYAQEQQRAT